MQLKTSEMSKVYDKLRFKTKQSDHLYARLKVADNLIIRIKVSHGKKNIDSFIIQKILKQMKLKYEELSLIKSCQKGFDYYINIVKNRY